MLHLPERAGPYALAQRTEVTTLADYAALMAAEFERLRPWLVSGDLLEIGCGIGAMAALMGPHVGGDLHLLDGTGWSERQAGWWGSREPWNDMALAREVVEANGGAVSSVLPIGSGDLPAVDNVVSLLSWGWHYPVDAYLDAVVRALRPGGRLVIDLRDNRPAERRALESAGLVHLGDVQRHWRPGARTVWRKPGSRAEKRPTPATGPRKDGPPLVIAAFKWGARFGADHVHRMRNMLARHLQMPHEFVCITDDPAGIAPDIRIVPLWSELREHGKCTVRLRAFAPDMAEIIGPRFAWIDLDCVLVDDVTAIFDRSEDFVISGVELPPQPYNGSLVMMDAGARREVYDDFDPVRLAAARRRLNYGGSDQAWIAIRLGPDEATWTEADGIYTYRDYIDPAPRMPTRPLRRAMEGPRTGGGLPDRAGPARMIVFNGAKYDPGLDRCQRLSPWISEHWR